MADNRPIGIFDSGVGGLSVLREIREILPRESLLYYADTGNNPYGVKTRQEIQRLSHGITEFLLSKGAKIIVVACNTATVASLAYLRATFPVPFVGMVPAVKPAASSSKARRVGVMATNATFQGEMFDELVEKFANDVAVVRQVCPGLVPAVEQGHIEHPSTRELVQEYVRPLLDAQVDTVVLGCTHYVFLRPLVEELVGPTVAVIDSGRAVAKQVARVLEERGLTCDETHTPETRYYTSGDTNQVRTVIINLIGDTDPVIAGVNID